MAFDEHISTMVEVLAVSPQAHGSLPWPVDGWLCQLPAEVSLSSYSGPGVQADPRCRRCVLRLQAAVANGDEHPWAKIGPTPARLSDMLDVCLAVVARLGEQHPTGEPVR